jgi:hypothetical protein
MIKTSKRHTINQMLLLIYLILFHCILLGGI